MNPQTALDAFVNICDRALPEGVLCKYSRAVLFFRPLNWRDHDQTPHDGTVQWIDVVGKNPNYFSRFPPASVGNLKYFSTFSRMRPSSILPDTRPVPV